MISELARVAVGVPAVVFALASLPWLTRHRVVGLVVGLVSLVGVVWPLLPGARGWLLLLVGGAAAGGLLWTVPRSGGDASPRPLPRMALAAGVLVVVVALVAGAQEASDAVERVLKSDTAWFVASMALLAVPVGGQAVAWALQPYATQVQPREPSLLDAGRVIGWFERSLLFALLAAGQPEAAGLALAAKTVARFPQLSSRDEPLAEYILVGTLASVAIAGACALVTRAALGLSPL